MESRISLVMIVQNMSLDALKFSVAFLIEFGEIKRRQKINLHRTKKESTKVKFLLLKTQNFINLVTTTVSLWLNYLVQYNKYKVTFKVLSQYIQLKFLYQLAH
jgi:uncharacterized membrane protein